MHCASTSLGCDRRRFDLGRRTDRRPCSGLARHCDRRPPRGKNEVWYYTNDKGNKIKVVGEDQDFNIVGKNLDHAVEVFCWADGAADDLDGHGGWDSVTDWSYGPTSKSLVDVDMDPDCADMRSAIQVQFDNKTPGDETDDIFVTGPSIEVKPES